MRTRFAALLLCIAACNGDDAQTTQDTGADDDDSSSATDPTDASADDDDDATDPSADDDATASSSDGTTAVDTSAGDTSTAGDSSTAADSDTSSSDDASDSSSSGEPGCVPIDAQPLVSTPLAGDSACEGVPNNAVIIDDDGLQAHFDEFCETLNSCQFPAPPCDDPPDVDLDAQRIVYVFGQSSGCTGTAQIDEVLDCGDEVEVHYTIGAAGPCGLIVYGWDSAVIPDGPDVVFIEG